MNDEELRQVVEALQELLDALEDATTKLSELPSFQSAIKAVREEQARRLLDSWQSIGTLNPDGVMYPK